MENFYNLIVMSTAFLVLFAAFNLSNYIQKVIVDSINLDFPNVEWNAYSASCVVYGVFSISNMIVPSIHTLLSYKSCLFIGSSIYFVFSLIYFFPFKYGLILASGLVGFGAGILWVTQGNYLAEISTQQIHKNSAIFWVVYQFSLVFGNLYFYIEFQGVEKIENSDRIHTFLFISILSLIATLMFLFLKKNKVKLQSDEKKVNSIDAFKSCLCLFKTKKIILLSVSCFYTGIEQTFFSGVYSACIAYTKRFGYDSKKYSGLYGCFAGFGAISGTFIFGIILSRYFKNRRLSVYFIGFLAQMISIVLIFLNHPSNSTIKDTYEMGWIEPKIWIAMLSGSFLALGDGLFNTQLLSLIGTVYKDPIELSSAFALYKFTHSAGASLSFFYASFDITLYSHLLILLIFNILGFITYYLAERLIKEENINNHSN